MNFNVLVTYHQVTSQESFIDFCSQQQQSAPLTISLPTLSIGLFFLLLKKKKSRRQWGKLQQLIFERSVSNHIIFRIQARTDLPIKLFLCFQDRVTISLYNAVVNTIQGTVYGCFKHCLVIIYSTRLHPLNIECPRFFFNFHWLSHQSKLMQFWGASLHALVQHPACKSLWAAGIKGESLYIVFLKT